MNKIIDFIGIGAGVLSLVGGAVLFGYLLYDTATRGACVERKPFNASVGQINDAPGLGVSGTYCSKWGGLNENTS